MGEISWSRSWAGIALIIIGVLFLAQSYLGYDLGNLWAFLILVPAVGSFLSAYERWQHGHTRAAGGAFTGGLMLTAIAVVFLLGLPWGRIWPIFVIIAGIGILLPNMLERSART